MRPMPKSTRPWTPTQSYLLPPSPLDWLPEGHLAYFILEVVAQLDLGEIEARIAEKDPRGERPYAPAMMVSLLLYGYCVGVFSSRRMARATWEDVAFRVIAGEAHPHFTTINQFRLEHLERLANLFVQALRLCQQAGLVKLGHVALDGAKIRAAASKHKAMSYSRMKDEEKRLRAEMEALLRRAQQVDAEEDDRYGVGQDDEDLPAELQRREQRLEKLRQAKAALEKEAAGSRAAQLREQAAAQRRKAADESVDPIERRRAETRARVSERQARELDDRNDDDQSGGAGAELPTHRIPTEPDGTPKPGAQRNLTDPDSRIMVKDGAFVQAFNAQIAVDAAHQVIVAHGLSNQAPDVEYLGPMVERVIDNCGAAPETMTADSGYFREGNITHMTARGIEPYVAVGRQRVAASSSAGQARAAMLLQLATAFGRWLYSRRKVVAEPPFGQIQEARRFRRFSLRGRRKAGHEWALVCLTHNLLKLYRFAGRCTERLASSGLRSAPAPVG